MPERKKLRVFISYAREDIAIAAAARSALDAALDNDFSEIFMDVGSIEAGDPFQVLITDQLDITDVLLIIYTGTGKHSHGFTGFEVGYFASVQKRSKAACEAPERAIVSMYRDVPPPTTGELQGLHFGIDTETLQDSPEHFSESLINAVTKEHPIVRFFQGLQARVIAIRIESGFTAGEPVDAVMCARKLLSTVFARLKETVDSVLKPQKQITILTSRAALNASEGKLPHDAVLRPVGSGNPMSIFSLSEKELTWSQFLERTAHHKLAIAWREAINDIISSTLQDVIDVDNSQIVCSSDETRLYRLILTTSTAYFNGNRELNIYLVEALRPPDHGNRNTTMLLKGLGLVCRFRSLFLEYNSDFHANTIELVAAAALPSAARNLLRELDLLTLASVASELDQPNDWGEFVDWNVIKEMSHAWAVYEPIVRAAASALSTANDDPAQIPALRAGLVEALDNMTHALGNLNQKLIKQMTLKLNQIVQKQVTTRSVQPKRVEEAARNRKPAHSGP
jgi:hypothetical protein